MALEVIWDTAADAEAADSLTEGRRVVRTAFYKGLDSDAVQDTQHALLDLLDNATGIPSRGDPFSTGYQSLICIHRIARPLPGTGGQMGRIWIHYQTPGGGGTPLERFAAEDSTVLVAEPTQKVPGTNTPLLVSLTGDAPDFEAATTQLVTANTPRTMRSLVLYGLFSDRPSSTVLGASNRVNGSGWQGLPTGYWRCEGPRVRYSSRDGMYAVSVGFLTKQDEDWSSYQFPRDPTTGQLAKPDQSILNTLLGQSYAHGIRHDTDGILKFGPYLTSPFGSIFGNSFPIGD